MNTTVSYRGYDGSIIHDAEDALYHGKVLGIRDVIIYHGYTPEEAEKIFRQAVDEYLGDCQQDGKEPPLPFASFPANLPHDLRVKAALFAQEHDVDLDSLFRNALADFLDRAA